MSRFIFGDCLEVMKGFDDNSIDTIITDPPYGLKFMGKDWDHGIPGVPFWNEMLRIAKPGAILLAFGGTRTHHRLMCAIEDADWQIRDCLMWLYGSGFPKSLNIGVSIDKAERGFPQGSTRGDPASPNSGKYKTQRTEGKRSESDKGQHFGAGPGQFMKEKGVKHIRNLKGDAAQWNSWGTSLKPAWEPIILAMKPLDGTYAENALKWGVAGLNVDGGRIEYLSEDDKGSATPQGKCTARSGNLAGMAQGGGKGRDRFERPELKGRWPANLLLDEQAAEMLDEQSGDRPSCNSPSKAKPESKYRPGQGNYQPQGVIYPGENGGASRFFYVTKASKKERGEYNDHPTVKPLKLMEYLCELTRTPSNGIVLDPFAGSGSTLLACIRTGRECVGIEDVRDTYLIATRRIREEKNK